MPRIPAAANAAPLPAILLGLYTREYAAEGFVFHIVGVFAPAVREARAGGLRHA